MKINNCLVFLFLLTALGFRLLGCPSSLLAQAETAKTTPAEATALPEDPYKDFPKSGVLSGSYSMGAENAAVAGPWGKKNSSPTANPPISGSVSKLSAKQWKAMVFNNSPDDFSVSLRVRQLNKNRENVKTDSFSVSLKSGKSEERIISSTQSTVDAELDLVGWKRTSKNRKATGDEEAGTEADQQ